MAGMAQRRHHYEVAFERFLRLRRVPYVSVNEARAALLPRGAALRLLPEQPGARPQTLKNFDFVIYGSPAHVDAPNLLVEVKGRKIARPRPGRPAAEGPRPAPGAPRRARLESWVNREDVAALEAWERLFGPEFRAVFVFVYWCDEQPPAALFEEIFEHRGRWYALRAIDLRDYRAAMRTRSERWGTVHLSGADFEALSRPFAPPALGLAPDPSALEPALAPIG